MIKKYKCIKELSLDKYDDDGFSVEGEYVITPVGSLWKYDDKQKYRFAGGRETYRLEIDQYCWIEITEKSLNEYFELVV